MRNFLFVTYVAACGLALTWPVYDRLGNHVEPSVWGLPFTLFWNVAWAIATFLALIVYHRTRPGATRRSG